MKNNLIHLVYIHAGLTHCGIDEGGENEYMGTIKAWKEAEALLDKASISEDRKFLLIDGESVGEIELDEEDEEENTMGFTDES